MESIIIDNTVLTNFSLVYQEELVKNVFNEKLYISEKVLLELKQGEERNIVPKRDWSWLKILKVESVKEHHLFDQLRLIYGAGESSCLSLAFYRSLKVLTDDYDARKYAQKIGIPVSGTIGVLILAIRKDILSLEEGNRILLKMIKNGYYSPYKTLDKLVL